MHAEFFGAVLHLAAPGQAALQPLPLHRQDVTAQVAGREGRPVHGSAKDER